MLTNANGKKTTITPNRTNWVSVGNPPGFAAHFDSASLAIASDGTPHLGYMDGANGLRATVMALATTQCNSVYENEHFAYAITTDKKEVKCTYGRPSGWSSYLNSEWKQNSNSFYYCVSRSGNPEHCKFFVF